MAELTSILMPTLAKVAPDIYKNVKEWSAKKKKIDDMQVFVMASLEMLARQQDNFSLMMKKFDEHQSLDTKRFNQTHDMLKGIRETVENAKGL
mgnify:CR=1 FL=1